MMSMEQKYFFRIKIINCLEDLEFKFNLSFNNKKEIINTFIEEIDKFNYKYIKSNDNSYVYHFVCKYLVNNEDCYEYNDSLYIKLEDVLWNSCSINKKLLYKLEKDPLFKFAFIKNIIDSNNYRDKNGINEDTSFVDDVEGYAKTVTNRSKYLEFYIKNKVKILLKIRGIKLNKDVSLNDIMRYVSKTMHINYNNDMTIIGYTSSKERLVKLDNILSNLMMNLWKNKYIIIDNNIIESYKYYLENTNGIVNENIKSDFVYGMLFTDICKKYNKNYELSDIENLVDYDIRKKKKYTSVSYSEYRSKINRNKVLGAGLAFSIIMALPGTPSACRKAKKAISNHSDKVISDIAESNFDIDNMYSIGENNLYNVAQYVMDGYENLNYQYDGNINYNNLIFYNTYLHLDNNSLYYMDKIFNIVRTEGVTDLTEENVFNEVVQYRCFIEYVYNYLLNNGYNVKQYKSCVEAYINMYNLEDKTYDKLDSTTREKIKELIKLYKDVSYKYSISLDFNYDLGLNNSKKKK